MPPTPTGTAPKAGHHDNSPPSLSYDFPIAGKATDFYKKNPKVVGGLALIASAMLLNRMKRPH